MKEEMTNYFHFQPVILSVSEYLRLLLQECRLAVGLRELRGKRIDLKITNEIEPNAKAIITVDEKDSNHFTIGVPPNFDWVDWTNTTKMILEA